MATSKSAVAPAKTAKAAKSPATKTPPRAVKAPAKTPLAKGLELQAAKQALAKSAAKKSSAVKPPVAEATAKVKHKLVRDSFTIPKTEYAVLQSLKQRAADLKRPVKKSELLRAGIAALNAMAAPAFLAALDVVPSLKTGRPTTKGSAE